MSEPIWHKPIFVFGNPRSGTSLLRLMLDSHESICIPPESHFFLWLEDKYGNWKPDFLGAYLADLFASTKFETWDIDKHSLKNYLLQNQIETYAQLNSLVYRFYALKQNKHIVYWGDKNSLWIDKLSTIHTFYPEAFYIHIIRDGRDVACSYKALNKKALTSEYAPKLPNGIEDIAEKWMININAIERFLSTKYEQNKIVIRYEDLIYKTKDTLKSILDKLDLQLTDAQMTYYNKPKSNIEPAAFFEWKEKLTQQPDKSNIGKFEHELSAHEIKTFNTIAKTNLSKYGYL